MVVISVICPTYNRCERHENLYEAFCQQSYKKRELLVFDDSPRPSPFFSNLADPRVRYTHTHMRHSIGVKRNLLVQMAVGDVIAHFDDDDYYGRDYLSKMYEQLVGADFVKLSKWLTWRESDGTLWEWDTSILDKTCFWVRATGQVRPLDECENWSEDQVAGYIHASLWGYGFSYVYRKSLWKACPFADMNFGEDYEFIQRCQTKGFQCKCLADLKQIVLHTLHSESASIILPQTKVDSSCAIKIFGSNVLPWLVIK
jgi:glycosyltransferase involved in cell wall biosynthesis